jgi:hypothetical protein
MGSAKSGGGNPVQVIELVWGSRGSASVTRVIPVKSPGRVSWVVGYLSALGRWVSMEFRTRRAATMAAYELCRGGAA